MTFFLNPFAGTAQKLRLQLFIPLIISSILIQFVVPMLRIGTSYKALDLGIPAALVGFLSAAFALAPMVLAIPIGRLSDKRGEGLAALLGGTSVFAAAGGFWLLPPSFASYLFLSSLLGLGQVLHLTSMQMVTTRCSSPSHYDQVLGYYMVAVTSGQILGPLLIGLTTPAGQLFPDDTLFAVATAASAALICLSVVLYCFLPRVERGPDYAPMSVGQVLRAPGLLWIIVASSLCVTASDLILVYFPVAAALAGTDAAVVGWLLTARSIGSLVSRFFYARAVAATGRVTLLVWSMVSAALATAAMAVELPVWGLALAMVLAGVGFGLALTAGLSLTIGLSPYDARSTALSLRISASRLGQFGIPLLASVLAVATGVGAIFALTGLALIGSATVVRAKVSPRPPGSTGKS